MQVRTLLLVVVALPLSTINAFTSTTPSSSSFTSTSHHHVHNGGNIVMGLNPFRKSQSNNNNIPNVRNSSNGLLRSKLSNLLWTNKGSNNKSKDSNLTERRLSSSTTTTGIILSNPSIVVRPRPMVSLDQRTGTYARIPFTTTTTTTKLDANRSDTNESSIVRVEYNINNSNEQSQSGWANFKDGIYNSIDNLKDFRNKLGSSSNTSSSSTKSLYSIKNRKLSNGYSDTIEKNTSTTITQESPGNKLLRQYESSLPNKGNNNEVVRISSNEEDMFRSDSRKKFDSFKDGIYDLFQKTTPKDKVSTTSTDTATVTASTTTLPSYSFKPVAKISANQQETTTALVPLLPELTSSNPWKRFKANLYLASQENIRQRREEQRKREEAIENTKQSVYKVIDSVQNAANAISNIPQKLEDTIEATQDVIEDTTIRVQETIEEVQDIPQKVQRSLQDINNSIQETKRISKIVVEDIQNIPTTVETKINDTQKSVEQTRENVLALVQQVEDLTFEAKVLAGLEKRKPKPPPLPPPPPPPMSNSEIAKEIATEVGLGVASLTGKAAWIIAKGMVSLTVSGVKLAWTAMTTPKEQTTTTTTLTENKNQQKMVIPKEFSKKEAKEINILSQLEATVGRPNSFLSEEDKKTEDFSLTDIEKSLSDIDPSLAKEISEALLLAQGALESATLEENRLSKSKGDKDIDDAVRRAKAAAAQAAKDAAELEDLFRKRNKSV